MTFVYGDPVLVDINGTKVPGVFQYQYVSEDIYDVQFPFGLLTRVPANLVEPAPKPVAVGDVIATPADALRMPYLTLFVEANGDDYGQVSYKYEDNRASFAYVGISDEYKHTSIEVDYPLTVLWVPPTSA